MEEEVEWDLIVVDMDSQGLILGVELCGQGIWRIEDSEQKQGAIVVRPPDVGEQEQHHVHIGERLPDRDSVHAEDEQHVERDVQRNNDGGAGTMGLVMPCKWRCIRSGWSTVLVVRLAPGRMRQGWGRQPKQRNGTAVRSSSRTAS